MRRSQATRSRVSSTKSFIIKREKEYVFKSRMALEIQIKSKSKRIIRSIAYSHSRWMAWINGKQARQPNRTVSFMASPTTSRPTNLGDQCHDWKFEPSRTARTWNEGQTHDGWGRTGKNHRYPQHISRQDWWFPLGGSPRPTHVWRISSCSKSEHQHTAVH